MTDGIFPYEEVDGVWTVRDSEMERLFEQFEEEGTINNIWNDGWIETPQDFITHYKNPLNPLYFVVIDGKIGAIVWLTDIEGGRAYIHFNALKYTWGSKIREAGENVLELFSGAFKCLLGMTPTSNKLACRFIKQIGMKPLCVIPNCLYNVLKGTNEDALLTCYIKENKNG